MVRKSKKSTSKRGKINWDEWEWDVTERQWYRLGHTPNGDVIYQWEDDFLQKVNDPVDEDHTDEDPTDEDPVDEDSVDEDLVDEPGSSPVELENDESSVDRIEEEFEAMTLGLGRRKKRKEASPIPSYAEDEELGDHGTFGQFIGPRNDHGKSNYLILPSRRSPYPPRRPLLNILLTRILSPDSDGHELDGETAINDDDFPDAAEDDDFEGGEPDETSYSRNYGHFDDRYSLFHVEEEPMGKGKTPESYLPGMRPVVGSGPGVPLGQNFKVESSWKFSPGTVFKAAYSEPAGLHSGPRNQKGTEAYFLKDRFGESHYAEVRRFIVVGTDVGSSTCVPITTYGGKGLKKHGSKANRHGIAYQWRRTKPKQLPGEPKLGFEPLPIDITARGEKISPESRINYSKLTTLEHNIRVFIIGEVVRDYVHQLSEAVDTCWAMKRRA